MQKTIHTVDDFPDTLEEKDSFNRDLLKDSMGYLKKMFDRKSIYGFVHFPSNFAIDTNKNGKFDEFGNYQKGNSVFRSLTGSCHGQFNVNHSTNTTFFINWFYRSRHKEECRLFYDWILDPKKSPWRDALQNTTILRDEDGDLPVCIIFRDLANEDIHLVTNFLIASRLNTEFHSAEIFAKLVSFGFSPPEAYALCPNFYVMNTFGISDSRYATLSIFDKTLWGTNGYGKAYETFAGYKITYGPFGTGDRPFYCNFDSKRLIDKSPSVRVKTPYLKNQCAPNPCNYVWAGTEAAEDRQSNELFEIPRQTQICDVTGHYTGMDIFGFWKQEPTKPSREKIAHIKKLLNTPKSERKERINLSA